MKPEEYKAFLASLGIDLSAPTRETLKIPPITAAQIRAFFAHLQTDKAAGRLRKRILPHCEVLNLASFIILMSYATVEQTLISGREERGRKLQDFIALVRQRARESKDPTVHESLRDILKTARLVYSTAWMGFSNAFGWIAVDRYIAYRTGLRLRPKEWSALLTAAFAATGRNRFIDGIRISENVHRFRAFAHLTGEKAAEWIERRLPT